MKIGIAQLDILWEKKLHNIKKCEDFFREASVSACDLLVFPELTLIGFSMDTSLAERFEESESISCFSKLCRRYSVDCVFGLSETDGGRFYNSLIHIDKHGEVTSKYRKMHPFSYGKEIYDAGDSCSSFNLSGNQIGLSICYDLRFPELYQQLSKHCRCIIVSANWPEKRAEHWITLLKARAIENQCFVLGCNCVGDQQGMAYSGDSIVVSPDGEVVARAEKYKEQLLCCDIDLSDADSIRRGFPLKTDRRINIYRNFYE